MSDSYENRIQRFLTTVEHREPDTLPILSMFETWSIGYANSTVQEIEENPEKEIEVYSAPHKDIYSDGTFVTGITFDAFSASSIGSESHFVSEDGQTVQHQETTPMEADEYDKLIADPRGFMFNELLPRRAKKLALPYPEKLAALQELAKHWIVKRDVQGRLTQKLKDDFNLPVLTAGIINPPMDVLFDYMRGFSGIAMDMRRQPDKLEAGIEALYHYCFDMLGITDETTSIPSFPFFATMMHVPTFISPKQFERFFWPTYKRQIDKVASLGGKLIVFLEGDWSNKYDFINDFPKDFAIGIMEGDDIFEAKKKIGGNITLAGGMPIELLKYADKQRCIDYAKKLIDECAPGGGYVFTSSRALLSKNDVKTENLIAVNEYVHQNGGK